MDSQSNLDDFLIKYKLPLVLGLVGLVLLIGGLWSSGIVSRTFVRSSKSFQPQVHQTTSGGAVYPQGEARTVKVDVSGEVTKPGVFVLSPDSRVEDALKMAGGVTKSADSVFVSKSLNLAQKVSDGMKIYVPKEGEAGVSAVAGVSAQRGLVNVNSASVSELEQLPGIGPVLAQKIIDKKPYAGIEELLTKKAVTKSAYEKIKGLISTY